MHPAKAVGRNETSFGRDTRVVPRNIILDRGRSSTRREDLGSEPAVRSDTAYHQITLALISLLLSPSDAHSAERVIATLTLSTLSV